MSVADAHVGADGVAYDVHNIDPIAIVSVPRALALGHDIAPLRINEQNDKLVIGVPSSDPYSFLSAEVLGELKQASKRDVECIGLPRRLVQDILAEHYPNTVTDAEGAVAFQKRFLDYVGVAVNRGADDLIIDHRGDHGEIILNTDNRGVSLGIVGLDDLRHLIRAALALGQIHGADDLTRPHRGRCVMQYENREIELRLIFQPTRNEAGTLGVRVVPDNRRYAELAQLGMPPAMLERYLGIISAFCKLVLAAGPPSMGKSTLMRASLYYYYKLTGSLLLRSIEWPVEATMSWLTQVSIEAGQATTVEETIEHFLGIPTQGVFFGEVRNLETLKQMLRLPLSAIPTWGTTHGDSAPETIWRLLHEGGDPFVLGQQLTCVIGQRLFGTLHADCSESVPHDDPSARLWLDAAALGGEKLVALARTADIRQPSAVSSACHSCMNGFLGRTPVFDLLEVTEDVRHQIYKKATTAEIAAADPNYVPMWVATAELVLTGKTSPLEALRYVRPPARRAVIA